MIAKGTEKYREASKVAKVLVHRGWFLPSEYANFREIQDAYYKTLEEVASLNIFASNIAKTIIGHRSDILVAKISEKQAWIIACAIIENNIDIANFLSIRAQLLPKKSLKQLREEYHEEDEVCWEAKEYVKRKFGKKCDLIIC